jgi:hypothetical protein
LPDTDNGAQDPAAAAAIVDWAGLVARFKGNAAFVERLAAIAVEANRGLPERLRQWSAQCNLTQIAAAAHGLKGLAGELLAGETAGLAAQVQRCARDGSPEAAGLALELADALERLLRVLGERIGAGEGAA